ncbi:MAG: hypothetical protein NT075_03735 [Chloroflexi bacterium]|nr:hypothetical protein [Chloroflexota bacterium]
MIERKPIEEREIAEDIRLTDADGNTGDDADSTPGWVKVFGVLFIVLVVIIVILHLTGHSLGGHTLR